ncbi:sensor histidine kinase [Taibaiella soli]|uniref:histidine kinase n=1 Tax=Taibaiella soli TaxID=1649169 RepID=A0A2W2BXY5_9BACT|nr:histidine kinase dimerization/phosphoacceptor domain -containing protein [Taibaiella soli]PZF72713.1 hypothetical protein DN068_12675 [Taibaiella soli]
MNKFLAVVVFICAFASAQAQNQRTVDSLLDAAKHANSDTARINLLLGLAKIYIVKEGDVAADLNVAAGYMAQAEQINAKVRSADATGYITLVSSYFEKDKSNGAQSKALAEKALQQLAANGTKLHLGEAYYAVADYYNVQDESEADKRIQLTQLGIKAYKDAGDIQNEAYGYQLLGGLYSMPAECLAALKRSLSLYQSIHYRQLQEVYMLMGDCYAAESNYTQALDYDLQALKTAEAAGDSTMLFSQINNHIAIVYDHLKDYPNSIIYYRKALPVAIKYKDKAAIFLITTNIVDAYLKTNRPEEARQLLTEVRSRFPVPSDYLNRYRNAAAFMNVYIALKQYDSAKIYSQQLLNLVNDKSSPANEYMRSDIYIYLIKYYLAVKDFAPARALLVKNDELVRTTKSLTRLRTSNGLWFSLDTLTGNYKSAVAHLMKYKEINDSLFTESKSKQLGQLQVQYETEKKEEKIRQLNQQAMLEKANLRQALLIKNITVAGIILVLIIAGMVLRQSIQRKRNNGIITQKNQQLNDMLIEKEWLLKEVHHRVKNNLHMVICLLESQAYYLEDDALKAIENTQHRIYAMSLIHQKLYQSDDVKTIDMALYLNEFVHHLTESFGAPAHIHTRLNVASLKLDVSQAIPLGLLINEAMTNAYKYAFPEGKQGEIYLELQPDGANIRMVVADNGVGMGHHIADEDADSLGLELIKGLAKDINGNVYFDSSEGTKITVIFNKAPFRKTAQTAIQDSITT